MGLEINRAISVGALQPNTRVNQNRYNMVFGTSLTADTFQSSSVKSLATEYYIQKAVNSNPKIRAIVKDFNPKLNLNIDELNELQRGHASDTQKYINGIADNLPFSLRSKVDIKAIDDAAYLHDVGKVLIPPEVLNKPARLNEQETKIMHTHSELSYEILKNSSLDKKTLELIRNHHQNAKKTGYPWVGKDFNADLNLQILSTADKFSALTEQRTYKEPMSNKKALTIIYQDVKDGKLHPFVFKALVNYVETNSLRSSEPNKITPMTIATTEANITAPAEISLAMPTRRE